ncbi:MAG: hypothetical protein Q4F63_06270 [Clostridia bacterium]|nr:hypothetical protein [Clostridia bacterium]
MDINKIITDKKGLAVIALFFIAGIMLIMGTGTEINKTNVKTESVSTDRLNKELESILSKVEGAGNVKVLINYKQSGEKILAYDMESSINEKEGGKENNTRSEVVYDGDKMPVILKEYMPKAEGVIIAAQGADNENVKNQLIAGTMALLGIDEHKIEVLKMK